jgi:hypothetical protein
MKQFPYPVTQFFRPFLSSILRIKPLCNAICIFFCGLFPCSFPLDLSWEGAIHEVLVFGYELHSYTWSGTGS